MTLRTAIYACMAGGILVLSLAILYVLPNFAREITSREIERTAQTRTESLALGLARTLFDDWEDLSRLAERIPTLEPEFARVYLDGVASSGRVSWVGYAGTNGIVQVASGGLLEGEDVSPRRWFSGGLNGGYAVDVHEAVLLQRLLAPDATEALRFIDLSLPVTNAAGRTIGVLGLHIDADWLEGFLAESAAVRDLDVFLVAANGQVEFSTVELEGAAGEIAALRAASAGTAMVAEEIWPDGKSYVSAVVPEVGYRTLPSFGWRLVGRVSADSLAATEAHVVRHIIGLGLAAAVIFMLAAFAFQRFYLRPVERLIATAERMSRGESAYPDEIRSSREGERLAAALVRLQSRQGSG
ncbi:cache domain-containing protein [Halovulum dunhuangense]|uniref:Cache domain-containing protein n=1 Tax=Halovulum dunhuangense TaxID=1505036 RepID=A0A849L703_9RHOB|nr:cache domain-containing protein [Halovulum dunhuangense]NNU82245.1 cache domain-containing protein [Halovulum dunhuangense]